MANAIKVRMNSSGDYAVIYPHHAAHGYSYPQGFARVLSDRLFEETKVPSFFVIEFGKASGEKFMMIGTNPDLMKKSLPEGSVAFPMEIVTSELALKA